MHHTVYIPKIISTYKYLIAFAAIGIIYICNLFIDIMEVDAAQYACISMEMSQTKSFLHIFEKGHDYLDKPPLLFWLSSVSMMLLGINNVAYKLPSLLIAILGIYSTYRYAQLYYEKDRAKLSALILASSQALYLMTNDVRTDTALMGLTMFSLWQLGSYLRSAKWKSLLLASMGVGMAMLAKGPIALIIPIIAVGSDIWLKRAWQKLWDYRWFVGLLIIGIVLLPMSYGLYTQYDLHPEKEVYGMKGPSGLRFYYWTQSFGRITGENYWKNDTSPFFFMHSILWDFFPWIFFFIPALITRIIALFKSRFRVSSDVEAMSVVTFILVFIAFSMSRYKLPHYIFVLFPLAAIITSDYIHRLSYRAIKSWARGYFIGLHLVWFAVITAFLFFFVNAHIGLWIFVFCMLSVYYLVKNKLREIERLTFLILTASVTLNFVMAAYFYPNLLHYQSGSKIGKYIKLHELNQQPVYYFMHHGHAADFYSHSIIQQISEDSVLQNNSYKLLLTSDDGIAFLNKNKLPYAMIKDFPHYHITALQLPFLYYKTRSEKVQNKYLVRVNH